MIIFQPDRILIRTQIKKYAHYIKGDVLDVGAGPFDRYSDLFRFSKYIKLDTCPDNSPDIIASAEKIPLGDNSVDSIVCTQALGDIWNLNGAISEFFRVLKSGGNVILTESLMAAMHDEPYDFWRFTDYSLRRLFEENGFDILHIERRGGFFASTAQNIIRYFIDRFNLYKNFLGKILSPFISVFGRLMLWLDRLDKSKAGARQSMGWCVVAVKK